jgi:hypothetical protein
MPLNLHSPYHLKILDYAVIAIPAILFPLSFIVFKGFFIASMAISTAIMGCLALVITAIKGVLRDILVRRGSSEIFLSFLLASAALYIALLLGGIFSVRIGMWGYVSEIYS